MKKYFCFMIAFCVVLMIPFVSFCEDEFDKEKYEATINEFDLSCFDELDNDTYNMLESLGLTDFDYNKILEFSFNDLLYSIKGIVRNSAETPIKSCLMIFIFIVFSSMFQSFKSTIGNNDIGMIYSTVSALIIAVVLVVKMKNTISISCTTMSVCADFIYAFVPVFCAIVATSGNTIAAFSTNTLLMTLAQALNYISNNIFIPLTNCFLAIGICSGIRSELNLHSLISMIKKYITAAISVCSASFVSILSIKTAIASKADVLGLRSMRFAINTVVPVIGSAISEGLLSIQTYSSLIRSSVGVVGIISVALVFLPSIIEVALWRLFLSLTSVVSEVFGDSSVSFILKIFCDAMLIMNVILILSMVTTIISIGILIAAKGSA